MNYQDSVRHLMTLGSELAAPRQPAAPGSPRAQKFDLRNITTLAEQMGSPHRAAPCAHIAGTNGKGSTAAMLASICRQAGMTTGLYTSPHLERINERIRINGDEISDEEFAAAFTRLGGLIERLLASGELAAHPTYFECLTAMAFDYFARQHVDFAVYEVGMGGRLDATNIVTPQVSVITQIDFDHENYLGHSIRQIAVEKAGIIKRGVPVVCAAGRPEAREVVARRAAELQAPFIDAETAYRIERAGALLAAPTVDLSRSACTTATLVEQASGWQVQIELPLAGRYQLKNAATAIAAARILGRTGTLACPRENGSGQTGVSVPLDDAIARGIRQVRWPGRLELLQREPVVYLDGTHNPAGARELLAFWDQNFAGRDIHLIYGAVRDKAVDEIAGLLFPRAHRVILTAPQQARAISAEALAEMVGGLARRLEVIAQPRAAVEHALATASASDVIFVTGSLYLVGDVRRWWKARTPQAAVRAV